MELLLLSLSQRGFDGELIPLVIRDQRRLDSPGLCGEQLGESVHFLPTLLFGLLDLALVSVVVGLLGVDGTQLVLLECLLSTSSPLSQPQWHALLAVSALLRVELEGHLLRALPVGENQHVRSELQLSGLRIGWLLRHGLQDLLEVAFRLCCRRSANLS